MAFLRSIGPILGAWRSLVARLHGEQEVAGSNPVAPTFFIPSAGFGRTIVSPLPRARPSRCRPERLLLADRLITRAAHERTRADHATEVAEDYVEAVADFIARTGTCRVTDLSGLFGVSHVTVIRIVKRLVGEGLLETEPYQPIGITAAGQALAERCSARHDVVYRFLLAIGVDEEVAAMDSEGIEHHVSPETLERFREIADRGAP